MRKKGDESRRGGEAAVSHQGDSNLSADLCSASATVSPRGCGPFCCHGNALQVLWIREELLVQLWRTNIREASRQSARCSAALSR